MDKYTNNLTPIEWVDGIAVKRDDLFEIAGVRGGKVRTCYALAQRAKSRGHTGIVTASARTSPQAVIVARVARLLGLSARCHMPAGAYTNEMRLTEEAGAEIIQHNFGRNSVIISRARSDAKQTGYSEIPFGMQCREAIEQTKKQVENLPPGIKRIVVTVGSSMSACGILHGLLDSKRDNLNILGVVVGAVPFSRLNAFAPMGWHRRLQLVMSPIAYSAPAPVTKFGDIDLDPYYEAKCLDYLKEGDLFWNVGIRPSV